MEMENTRYPNIVTFKLSSGRCMRKQNFYNNPKQIEGYSGNTDI